MILAIAIILMQLADGWTIYQAIKSGAVERMRITKWLLDRFGVYRGLVIAKGFAVLVTIGLYLAGAGWLPLAVLSAVYAAVLINNFKVLRKVKG